MSWHCGFGEIDKIGVEGTGCYGAGLARHLRQANISVVEVDRPNNRSTNPCPTLDEIRSRAQPG